MARFLTSVSRFMMHAGIPMRALRKCRSISQAMMYSPHLIVPALDPRPLPTSPAMVTTRVLALHLRQHRSNFTTNTATTYITGSDYILRPEVLESNFYAWRATGNTKYLDNAASAIQSFKKYLPTTVAYAGINDVNDVASTKNNDMASFWFGEVLKYLYVLFLRGAVTFSNRLARLV